MKFKNNTFLYLLALLFLFGIAVFVDYKIKMAGIESGKTFNFLFLVQIFNYRSLIRISITLAFFIILYVIKPEPHISPWILISVGVLSLILINFMPGRRLDFLRDFYRNLVNVISSNLGLTEHFTTLMVAYGIYQLIKKRFRNADMLSETPENTSE